jgi:hypothetical protein
MKSEATRAAAAILALAALGVLAQAVEEPGSLVAEKTIDNTVMDHHQVVDPPHRPSAEAQVGNAILLEEDEGGSGKGIGGWAAAQKGAHAYKTLPQSIYDKRNIARRDYSGNPVTKEFCGGPKYYDKKKCSSEYEASMVMTASPFISWAIFSLVLWIIVLIGRNCCLCCGSGLFGGKYPTKGWCYGDLRDADQGYSECERSAFLVLVILIFLLVVVGMFVGWAGNTEMSEGMDALISITGDIPHKMLAIVTPLQAEVASLQVLTAKVNPYAQPSMWTSIKDGLAQAAEGAKSMEKQVSKSLDMVRGVENERSSYFYTGLWIPFILSLVGMLGYLCPVLLTIFVVPCVAIMTVVLFLAIGIHVPVAVSTADFCVGLNYGLSHPNASSPLDVLVGCHGETGATKLAQTSKYFEQASAGVACSTLNHTMCNLAEVAYPDKHGTTQRFKPVTCPEIQCTAATLPEFMKKTVVRDFLWGCGTLKSGNIVTKDCAFPDKAKAKNECLSKYGNTDVLPCLPGSDTANYREISLSQCNSTCFHKETKQHSFTVVGNYEVGTRFAALQAKIQPLSDCTFVKQQASLFEHKLCWDVVEGCDYIMAGLTVIASAFFVGNFIYLGAYKRFHRKYIGESWNTERARILSVTGGPPEPATQPLLGQPKPNEADQV